MRPSAALHNLDFGWGQVVEGVNQAVDFAVGGLDLALEHGALGWGLGGGELAVEREHALDQGDDLVVALDVGGVMRNYNWNW